MLESVEDHALRLKRKRELREQGIQQMLTAYVQTAGISRILEMLAAIMTNEETE